MPAKSNNSSETHCVYLGVLADKHLTWEYHIEVIRAKISKIIGLIPKQWHSIPLHGLLYIYQTLIHPHLNYGLCCEFIQCVTLVCIFV